MCIIRHQDNFNTYRDKLMKYKDKTQILSVNKYLELFDLRLQK